MGFLSLERGADWASGSGGIGCGRRRRQTDQESMGQARAGSNRVISPITAALLPFDKHCLSPVSSPIFPSIVFCGETLYTQSGELGGIGAACPPAPSAPVMELICNWPQSSTMGNLCRLHKLAADQCKQQTVPARQCEQTRFYLQWLSGKKTDWSPGHQSSYLRQSPAGEAWHRP
ncbi:hypothetical protein BaRGS_00011901 [Batillaria attramentaria]|uniref:Uncharacterized protein n=1 Tax=Batillaria attramentaria TaxID=370345 RepID=A0ABD0LCQ0_9CAEN